MMRESGREPMLRTAAVVAVVFGVMTVASGGRALFGGESAREALGAIVMFVLWFNFGAGFAYVAAGVGLWVRARWAAPLSVLIAIATACVAVAFGVHVLSGAPYELRTVVALALRVLVWAWIAHVAWRRLRTRIGHGEPR